MKKLIVVEPTEKYIDFLIKNDWGYESFREGNTHMLAIRAEGRPIPKKEMIIGLHSYVIDDVKQVKDCYVFYAKGQFKIYKKGQMLASVDTMEDAEEWIEKLYGCDLGHCR